MGRENQVGGRIGPPHQRLLETEIEGEVSLYDPETERVTVLNATASDVWRLADGDHTAADIVSLLAQSYGVAPDDIQDDIEKAIHSLTEAGLFESP